MKTHLRNSIVGRVDSLQTFFTGDPNADIGSLNHADIVGTVSDRKCHNTQTVLHELDYEGLLERRHTTANDTAALGG